tara:strand:+ start:518 stop:1456 length:939 start_codon:yes stop_codon:yes gene_type:complete
MNRLIFIFIIYCLLFGEYSGGHPGTNFNYGSNAKDIGLSKSTLSVYNKGFNAFINPALLPKVKNNEYGFSYFMMSLDRSVQSLSISRPLPPSAGVSLSFFSSRTDDIIETNSFGSPIGELSHFEGYGMLSFGIDLGKISGGFNIKAYFNNLDEYSAKGIGFDIGCLYEGDNLNLAFKINNISSDYSWDIETSQYVEKIPVNYAMGLSYHKFRNILVTSQINMIPIIQRDQKEKLFSKIHLGVEYMLNYKDSFPMLIRMGMRELNDDLSFSLGFGMPFKIGKNLNLHLDYALDPGIMNEGLSHLFSFTMESNK